MLAISLGTMLLSAGRALGCHVTVELCCLIITHLLSLPVCPSSSLAIRQATHRPQGQRGPPRRTVQEDRRGGSRTSPCPSRQPFRRGQTTTATCQEVGEV